MFMKACSVLSACFASGCAARRISKGESNTMKKNYESEIAVCAINVMDDETEKLVRSVLAGPAGACKPSRDSIDERIVKSVRDKTGTSRLKALARGP
jgi:hypothetical protein